MPYFVWIEGLGGKPEPQLWATEPVDGNGKPTKQVLFKKKLTEAQELLNFKELITIFENEIL